MTPDDRAKMLKFLRLLSSDQLGERAAAGAMANRLAEKLGGWEQVLVGASADGTAGMSGMDDIWKSSQRARAEKDAYYNRYYTDLYSGGPTIDVASLRAAMQEWARKMREGQ